MIMTVSQLNQGRHEQYHDQQERDPVFAASWHLRKSPIAGDYNINNRAK
jgi:hypothetical protein